MAEDRTVIVQGVPVVLTYYRSQGGRRDKCKKADTEILEKLFSKFGLAKCTFLCKSRPVKDRFCHMTFDNSGDALRAYRASKNGEIQVRNKALTLTLISEEHTIDSLKDKCLMKIFSLLDEKNRLTVEEVCKRWKTLAQRSWFNQKVIDLEKSFVKKNFKKILTRCGQYVTDVISSRSEEISYNCFLSLVQQYCKNIRKLVIYVGNSEWCDEEHPTDVKETYKAMKTLRSLELRDYLSDSSFEVMESLPVEMEELLFTTGNLENATYSSLSLDLSRFSNLRCLTLKGFTVDDKALRGLENCKNLINFSFDYSRVHPLNFEKLTNLTNLATLHIPSCVIDDETLIKIIMNNRDLKDLEITSNHHLTDRSLKVISELPKLQILKMANMHKLELSSISEMRELISLDCENCSSIEEETLCKIIHSSPKLTDLNITGCIVSTDLHKVANSVANTRTAGCILNLTTDIRDSLDGEECSPNLILHYPWHLHEEADMMLDGCC